MDCNDISCPYITGSNDVCYECVLPSNESCERLDNDGIPNCEDCPYWKRYNDGVSCSGLGGDGLINEF